MPLEKGKGVTRIVIPFSFLFIKNIFHHLSQHFNHQVYCNTRDILDKAYRQLRKTRKEILKERELEENRHKRIVEDFDRRDDVVDNGHIQLNNIAELLGI